LIEPLKLLAFLTILSTNAAWENSMIIATDLKLGLELSGCACEVTGQAEL